MIYDLMALGVRRLPDAKADLDAYTLYYLGRRWWAKTLAGL